METDSNLIYFLALLLPFSVPYLFSKSSLLFCKHKSAAQASKEEVYKEKQATASTHDLEKGLWKRKAYYRPGNNDSCGHIIIPSSTESRKYF